MTFPARATVSRHLVQHSLPVQTRQALVHVLWRIDTAFTDDYEFGRVLLVSSCQVEKYLSVQVLQTNDNVDLIAEVFRVVGLVEETCVELDIYTCARAPTSLGGQSGFLEGCSWWRTVQLLNSDLLVRDVPFDVFAKAMSIVLSEEGPEALVAFQTELIAGHYGVPFTGPIAQQCFLKE